MTQTNTPPADATRAQVEAESNTTPRTHADRDAPRTDQPETREVPTTDVAPPADARPQRDDVPAAPDTASALPTPRIASGPGPRTASSPRPSLVDDLLSLAQSYPRAALAFAILVGLLLIWRARR